MTNGLNERASFRCMSNGMSSLISHPLFDFKVSYLRALELQARLLQKLGRVKSRNTFPLMMT
jgi:hypothetical protein